MPEDRKMAADTAQALPAETCREDIFLMCRIFREARVARLTETRDRVRAAG